MNLIASWRKACPTPYHVGSTKHKYVGFSVEFVCCLQRNLDIHCVRMPIVGWTLRHVHSHHIGTAGGTKKNIS